MSKAAAFTAVEPKPTELTVFGQLQGATGLAASSAHCMWRISHGKTWTLERGEGSGSSQTATTNEIARSVTEADGISAQRDV